MRRSKLSLLLLIGSSVALLALAIARLRWQEIGQKLEGAVLFPWLPLAVASYLLGHVVRGVRCRLLVSREAALTLPTATNVGVVGYALNNILPFRLGEFARAGMLAERSGLPFVQTLTVTFLERVLDGLALLFLLFLASFFHPLEGWMAGMARRAGLLFALAGFAVILLVTCPGVVLSAASRLTIRLRPGIHDGVRRMGTRVVNGMRFLSRPGDALRIGLLSLLVWLLEAGLYLSLLPAFGLPASPSVALLVMGITNLGVLVPSNPGYLGTFHKFFIQSLAATGAAADAASGNALLAHAVIFIPITIWGAGVLVSYGLALSKAAMVRNDAEPAASMLRDVTPFPGTLLAQSRVLEARRAPTPYFCALVEALLPPDGAKSDADRRSVVLSVAAFVQGQHDELPDRLRAMLWAGMLGFRVITRIVHWRSFCALPLDRRRRWVEWWAYGPVPLARQLFRSVRSTALLAYFEDLAR